MAAAIVLFALPACKTIDRNIALTQEAVVPITVGEASNVSAIDLSQALLQAGFTREQILKHGPELHTALATSGGAQLRIDRVVEAVFAVHSNRLYITSRARGTFVVPLGEAADKAEL